LRSGAGDCCADSTATTNENHALIGTLLDLTAFFCVSARQSSLDRIRSSVRKSETIEIDLDDARLRSRCGLNVSDRSANVTASGDHGIVLEPDRVFDDCIEGLALTNARGLELRLGSDEDDASCGKGQPVLRLC
jgi:hypothetical protein